MLFALVAVVIVAPFERVLVTWPGVMTLTSVEVVVLFALGCYVVELARHGRRALPALPRQVVFGAVAFIAVLAVAAAMTSFERGNAARFAMRMVVAAVLFAAAARTIDTPNRARVVAAWLLVVGSIVAAIAVLEAMQLGTVMTALTAFRPGFHVVAGQLRATSTLAYPTIASMYLEAAFVIGLYLLMSARTTPAWERPVVFGALVVIGAGISATFTRAGLMAMALSLTVVGALTVSRSTQPRVVLRTISTLAAVLVAVVFLTHSPELLAARLTSEGSEAWYGAEYEVPSAFAMRTGAVHRVPIGLTNTGRLTWDSQKEPAFALSYHWVQDDGGEVVEFEGHRTPFPRAVRPGQRVHLDATVIAPARPGRYTLAWDLVHESRAWLSAEGVALARTAVDVSGDAQPQPMTRVTQLPATTMRPVRPALWAAALKLAREHPILGIGPDNFRFAYGAHLGAARWDTRVHANNMYLEVLVGSGVVGLAALVWLGIAMAQSLWRRVQIAATPDQHVAAVVAMALWLVIAGHGLVDSFLSFTSTYVTFAVTCGWALSRGVVRGAPDANRI
jgi:hypothetical protein